MIPVKVKFLHVVRDQYVVHTKVVPARIVHFLLCFCVPRTKQIFTFFFDKVHINIVDNGIIPLNLVSPFCSTVQK